MKGFLKIYSMLSYVAIPFALGRVVIKGIKNPDYLKRIPERLGINPLPLLESSIWLHAVSVGEVQAAMPILKQLQLLYPSLPLVVTTTTPTGSALLQKSIKNIFHCYLPYDISPAISGFIKKINPCAVLIMETEIWPNLFEKVGQKNIPLFIINARLSPSSVKNYKKIKGIISKVLSNCTYILAQNSKERDHFLEIGTPEEKVITTGNIKFDMSPPVDKIKEGKKIKNAFLSDNIIWIGASTHEGEEEALLNIYKKLLKEYPRLKLVLVPRHPERFSTVASLVKKRGFILHRRSDALIPKGDFEVYLGDSMGELFLYYAMSDMAFVGGSLTPVGGHNILEPASLGLPIITGPHLHNFKEITSDYQKEGALLIAKDKPHLESHIRTLLESPAKGALMGKKAKDIFEKNKGATDKIIRIISSNLSPSKKP